MRKAGLKQRSRRRGATNNSGNANAQNNDAMSSGPAPEPPSTGVDNGERRKPTQEEAALSARNNRLAKELNEIRVRLRDETKTVTRLTMENMNLATRCREAITHVAILKRELTLTQRRAAEHLRQEDGRSLTPAGSSLNGDGGTPPSGSISNHPEHEHHQRNAEYNANSQNTYIGKVVDSDEMFRAFDDEASMQDDDYIDSDEDDKDEDNDQLDYRYNERQYDYEDGSSPQPQMNNSFGEQEGPADELLFDNQLESNSHSKPENFSPAINGVPISSDYFLQSSNNSTPEPDSSENLNIGKTNFNQGPFSAFEPSPNSNNFKHENRAASPPPPSSQLPSNPKPQQHGRTSSLDAFEASFENTFPSFSSSFEENPQLKMAFDVPEFADPFFLGSLDLGTDDTGGNAFGELQSSAFDPSKSKSRSPKTFGLREPNPVNGMNNEPETTPRQSKFSSFHLSSQPQSDDTLPNEPSPFDSNKVFQAASLDLFPPPTSNGFDFTDNQSPTQFQNSGSSSVEQPFTSTRTTHLSNENNIEIKNSSPPQASKKSTYNAARARYLAATADSNASSDNSSFNTVRSNELRQNEAPADKSEQMFAANSSRRSVQRKKKDGDIMNVGTQNSNRYPSSNKKSSPSGGHIVKNMIQSKDASRTTTVNPHTITNSNISKNIVRRNIRHQVAYTDTTMNSSSSKLRRSQDYFIKKETLGNGSQPDIKEAENILKDLESSSIIHNVT